MHWWRVICWLKVAYQFAERNNIPHTFNDQKQEPGKDWLAIFLSRHPELSPGTLENTSVARASAFNRVNVNKYLICLNLKLTNTSLQQTENWDNCCSQRTRQNIRCWWNWDNCCSQQTRQNIQCWWNWDNYVKWDVSPCTLTHPHSVLYFKLFWFILKAVLLFVNMFATI